MTATEMNDRRYLLRGIGPMAANLLVPPGQIEAEAVGLPVAEAPDADVAIGLLENAPGDYGTLFTDIDMHGSMSGLDLAGRVHARWPHIRLVVTSVRVAPRNGDIPDDGSFLSKPYSQADLIGAVARAA